MIEKVDVLARQCAKYEGEGLRLEAEIDEKLSKSDHLPIRVIVNDYPKCVRDAVAFAYEQDGQYKVSTEVSDAYMYKDKPCEFMILE